MGISDEIKQQSLAVIVMMGLAIVAVIGMIVLDQFATVADTLDLGNGSISSSPNATVQTTITLFIAAFALFGSFASITALVILVKAIIGIVRGLQ